MQKLLHFIFGTAVLFFLNFGVNSCVSVESNDHNVDILYNNIHKEFSSKVRVDNFGDIKQILVNDFTKNVSLFSLRFTDVVYHEKIIY